MSTRSIPATTAPSPEEAAQRLRTAIGRLNRRLRLTPAGRDLPPSQHEVLGSVARRGPLRLSELADLEGLNPTMLSRIVGKLEAAGLLLRTADAHDGRVVHIEATAAGVALHDEIRAERTVALLRAFSALSEGERAALSDALPSLEALAETLRQASA